MQLIDVHNHLAWDIDDGMPTYEDAKKSLERAHKDGIVKMIATPHFVPGFPITNKDISNRNRRLDELLQLAQQYEIELFHGSEIFLNYEYLEMIEQHQFYTLGDSSYILVEFDVRKDIASIEDADDRLYELQIRKYRPLIAHAERYFHEEIDLDRIRRWIAMGCFIQVNRTSLLGLHGKVNKKNAALLLSHGLVHVVASDAHRAVGTRVCQLSDAYDHIKEKYSKLYADMLLYENPLRILQNKCMETMQVHKKSWLQRLWKRGE